VEINFKAFPLPFYASFRLMAAPPLGRRCAKCGREHKEDDCVYDGKGGADRAEAYKGCNYLFCDARGEHSHKVCPTLNHRCGNCLF
jgi:hypothetical protein